MKKKHEHEASHWEHFLLSEYDGSNRRYWSRPVCVCGALVFDTDRLINCVSEKFASESEARQAL